MARASVAEHTRLSLFLMRRGLRRATGRASNLPLLPWRMMSSKSDRMLLSPQDLRTADGTRAGYDLELTRAVADAVSIPVIASGGAGSARDVADALDVAQAALLASILHENPARLESLRAELHGLGVPLRDAA